jgi:hypothetical protein
MYPRASLVWLRIGSDLFKSTTSAKRRIWKIERLEVLSVSPQSQIQTPLVALEHGHTRRRDGFLLSTPRSTVTL